MKRVPFATLVLILLFVLSFFNFRHIRSVCTETAAYLDQGISAARQEQLEEASRALTRAQERFEKSGTYLSSVVRHDELDEANLSFSRLSAMLAQEDLDGFVEEASYLVRLVNHICEMEGLSVGNIL